MSTGDAAVEDVGNAAADLIRQYNEAQKRWITTRPPTENGHFTERVAIYVALSVLLKAFRLDDLVTDPESLARVQALIDSVVIETGPTPEIPKARA